MKIRCKKNDDEQFLYWCKNVHWCSNLNNRGENLLPLSRQQCINGYNFHLGDFDLTPYKQLFQVSFSPHGEKKWEIIKAAKKVLSIKQIRIVLEMSSGAVTSCENSADKESKIPRFFILDVRTAWNIQRENYVQKWWVLNYWDFHAVVALKFNLNYRHLVLSFANKASNSKLECLLGSIFESVCIA